MYRRKSNSVPFYTFLGRGMQLVLRYRHSSSRSSSYQSEPKELGYNGQPKHASTFQGKKAQFTTHLQMMKNSCSTLHPYPFIVDESKKRLLSLLYRDSHNEYNKCIEKAQKYEDFLTNANESDMLAVYNYLVKEKFIQANHLWQTKTKFWLE